MILLGNILIGLGQVLHSLLSFMIFVVIVRAVISWVNPDPYNPIVRFLSAMTDPILNWLKRKIRLTFGGIDFSPLLLLFLLAFGQAVVAQSLVDYGAQIKMEGARTRELTPEFLNVQ